MNKFISSQILVLFILMFIPTLDAQIVGETSTCIENYRFYTFPTVQGNLYNWSVTGGSEIATSADKDSFEVIWTTNFQGTISLTEVDIVNSVTNYYELNVDLHGLPLPFATSNFSSDCSRLKGEYTANKKKLAPILSTSQECYTVCENSVVRFYANGQAGSSFTWDAAGSYSIVQNWGDSIDILFNTIGTATLILFETNIYGCENGTAYCINIVEKPSASFDILSPFASNNEIDICLGQNLQFQNTSNYLGLYQLAWFVDHTWFSSAEISNYTFDAPGDYEISMVIKNNCNCTDTAYATVHVSQVPGATFVCPGVVCENATISYTTDAICSPYNYTIVGSNNYVINGNEIQITWDDIPDNGYGQIILDGSTCSNVCTAPTVLNIPVIQQNGVITGNNTICINSGYANYSLPLWPGTNYNWTIINQTGFATIVNPNSNAIIIELSNNTGSIMIHVDYFNDLLNCGGSADYTITISDNLSLNPVTNVCAFENVVFNASPTSSSQPYYWFIDNILQPSSSSAQLNYTFNIPGNYQVKVSNSDFCNIPTTDLIVLEVPPVALNIEGEDSICRDEYYTYTAQTSSNDYYIEWEIIDGLSTTYDEGSSIIVRFSSATGPYLVRCRQLNVDNPNCASDFLEFNVYPNLPPSVSISGDYQVCANSTNFYTSSLGTSLFYNWSLSDPNVGSIYGASESEIEIQWNNVSVIPTNVTLNLTTITCGDTVSVDLPITITNGPIPGILITGNFCAGDEINFAATGIISAASYNWSFNPGGTSPNHQQNIDRIFNTPGTYVVNLEVVNPNACISTVFAAATFDILPSPVAAISIDTGDVRYCLDSVNVFDVFVQLVRTSQSEPNYEYNWLRNGIVIPGTTNQDFLIIDNTLFGLPLTTAGVVEFSLQVTDLITGCSDESNIVRIILENCVPPCNSFAVTSSPSFTRTCNSVNFSANISHPQFQFGNLLWNINYPSSLPQYQFNTNNPFSYNYSHSGIYQIYNRITFYENDGVSITDSSVICFTDTIIEVVVPLVPSFEYTFACNTSNTMQVFFNDNSNYVASYTTINQSNWSIIDNSTNTSVYNGPTPPQILSPGNYTVTLSETFSYNDGNTIISNETCSTSQVVHVPAPAQAAFTFMPNPVCVGVPVEFTDNSTGNIISWHWDYGDGTESLLQNSVRTYTGLSGGLDRNVTLNIMDEFGCTSQSLFVVTVNPDNFHQVIDGDSLGCPGQEIVLGTVMGPTPLFTYSTSPISFLWSTNESTSTIAVSSPGLYSVELTDGFGCVETAAFQVHFASSPAAVIVGQDYACQNTNFILQGPLQGGLNYVWQLSDNLGATWSTFFTGNTYSANAGYNNNGIWWQNNLNNPNNYQIRLILDQNLPGGISCQDTSEIFHFEVLPNIAYPSLSINHNCNMPINIAITNLAAYNTPFINWSNGLSNVFDIDVYFSGLYSVSITDSFGCTSTGSVDLASMPDDSYFGMGCVETCDSVLPASLNPQLPQAFSWQWMHNNNYVTGPGYSGFYSTPGNLVLTNAAEYGNWSIEIVQNYNGIKCTDTLSFLDLDLASCCEGFEPVLSLSDTVWCLGDTIIVTQGNFSAILGNYIIHENTIISQEIFTEWIPILADSLVSDTFYVDESFDFFTEGGCYTYCIIVATDTLINACIDTICVNFCVIHDCCSDSLWAFLGFEDDTLCNMATPFLQIGATHGFHYNFLNSGETGDVLISDLPLAYYNPITHTYSIPIEDMDPNVNTTNYLYIIPHNGNSLDDATCIGDTLWTSVTFEPCEGCDAQALQPFIYYEFQGNSLFVYDHSFSAYGYDLVEIWYNGQYQSGAPHSGFNFTTNSSSLCDTIIIGITEFLENNICCKSWDTIYVCKNCDNLNFYANFQSSNSQNYWYFTYTGFPIPDVVSWTFPDGSQIAGNVASNPNVLYPNWYDYNGQGGEVCVVAMIHLSDSLCCNQEYCFTLPTYNNPCEELENEMEVKVNANLDGSYSFTIEPNNILNDPNVFVTSIKWNFGDFSPIVYNDYNPSHIYLCDPEATKIYQGSVAISLTTYINGQVYNCDIKLPIYVKVPPCEFGTSKVKVYPNPTSDLLNIDFRGIDVRGLSFEIVDVLGNVLYEKHEVLHALEIINVSKWSNGLYHVIIRNEQELRIEKFVKE